MVSNLFKPLFKCFYIYYRMIYQTNVCLRNPSSVNEHLTMLVKGSSDFHQHVISNNHYVVVDSIPNQLDSYSPPFCPFFTLL